MRLTQAKQLSESPAKTKCMNSVNPVILLRVLLLNTMVHIYCTDIDFEFDFTQCFFKFLDDDTVEQIKWSLTALTLKFSRVIYL